MAASVRLELHGLKEAQQKAEQVARDLDGPPMVQAMRDATLLVERTAKQEASVDTGRYRASITPEVRSHGSVVEGIVGSNLEYAPYVVLGTRPHMPPIAALQVWARRHGVSAYVAARAIARRGTRGDQSLIKGIEQNAERISRLLGDAVGRIVER